MKYPLIKQQFLHFTLVFYVKKKTLQPKLFPGAGHNFGFSAKVASETLLVQELSFALRLGRAINNSQQQKDF
jgi:hypothetical protein